MNPALAKDPTALRVNLTAPTTAVRIGPFSFDGLKALLGVDLAEVLSPLMVAPKFQRSVPGGFIDVFPLAIPDGEGLSIPVKLLGGVGFWNMRGVLVLQVPPAAVDLVRAQLVTEIAAGEAAGPRHADNGAGGTVTEFAVRLRPGMRKAIPLGNFGELGVEAG
ncbi:MAG: hypothetical protein Q8P18_28170 [Pseudomonadota bacterium]|nr:hypothetical protein [Pseudomonadota bacterium]